MPATTSHKARELSVSDIPTDRPVITLDVDGVLNAFDHGRKLHSWQRPIEDDPVLFRINHSRRVQVPQEMCDEFGYYGGHSFKITWSDELMGELEDVARKGAATLVWLTSWNEFADFLGWNCFWRRRPSPVLGYVDCTLGGRRSSYAGKVSAIDGICDAMQAAHPDGDVPYVISFDDDRPWESRMWNDPHAKPLPAFFQGIGTDPRHGITKSQLDGVLELIG